MCTALARIESITTNCFSIPHASQSNDSSSSSSSSLEWLDKDACTFVTIHTNLSCVKCKCTTKPSEADHYLGNISKLGLIVNGIRSSEQWTSSEVWGWSWFLNIIRRNKNKTLRLWLLASRNRNRSRIKSRAFLFELRLDAVKSWEIYTQKSNYLSGNKMKQDSSVIFIRICLFWQRRRQRQRWWRWQWCSSKQKNKNRTKCSL